MKTAKQLIKKAQQWEEREKRARKELAEGSNDPMTIACCNTTIALACEEAAKLRVKASEKIGKK